MKKKISFELFVEVLWRGSCQVFRKIGKFFSFKEGMSFGKVLWRVIASCFTLLFAIFTLLFVYALLYEVVYKDWIRPYTAEVVSSERYLSNHIVFQDMCYNRKGRVCDVGSGEVLVKEVDWVVVSDDMDSLAVFSSHGKRGYLNRFTGEVVIQPTYSKAWVFSEGLAAVEKDKKLMFIDRTGKVMIDNKLEVYVEDISYAFHDGYCVVKNPVDGKEGLIDKQGNWALHPEYDNIHHAEGLWKVTKDGLYGLFSEKLDTMFVAENLKITIWDGTIEVGFPNHVVKRFDYQGNMTVDFVIDDVLNMEYETTELKMNEDENMSVTIYDVAKCQKYKVGPTPYDDYFGLIDRNGKRITPPDYTSIEAIAEDLYLCQPQGIILNGKGERVK